MEIISGVERRRRWRHEDKPRIFAGIGGGAKPNDVARRHDVSCGLLWQRREARWRGWLAAEVPTFVPLRVVPELRAPESREMAAPSPAAFAGAEGAPDDRIEIVRSGSTAVRVAEEIGAARVIPAPLRRPHLARGRAHGHAPLCGGRGYAAWELRASGFLPVGWKRRSE